MTIGSRGGKGGKPWSYSPAGPNTCFEEKTCHYYLLCCTFKSRTYGGGGRDKKTIEFDADEYLINIFGTISNGVLQSLELKTNQNTYGPFGWNHNGQRVEARVKDGQIVGFCGHEGAYIDNIVIQVKPVWFHYDFYSCFCGQLMFCFVYGSAKGMNRTLCSTSACYPLC